MAKYKSFTKSLPGFFNILVYFWPQIRKQRRLIALSFSALLAEILFRLLEPWPLKFVLDEVITSTSGNNTVSIEYFKQMDSMTLLTISALAVILFTGMRSLLRYWNRVGFALVGNKVLTEVRATLYKHLQCLPLSFHNKAKSGDLTIRMVGDVGQLKEIAITALLPLLGNILILAGMFTIMFVFNWKLSLLALVTFPLFAFSTARFSKKIKNVSKVQKKRESAIASTTSESMSAIQTVQALSMGDKFQSTFSSQNNKSLKDGVKAKKLIAAHQRTTDLLGAVATALVLWFGAKLVISSQISAGGLIVFLSYLKSSSSLISNFTKYTDRIAKASASGDRIMEILNQTTVTHNDSNAVTAPKFEGSITFENLDFSYDDNLKVLNNINFHVNEGQRLLITGPSGSGKSTITSLLMRLYEPQKGKVKIDDIDIREFTVESLRSQMSIILQDTVLFAASIKDNIAAGMNDVSMEQIEAAARLANIDSFIKSLPQGYDTVLGERAVNLSGGQRQRIAIARAAFRNAPILILDEPTSGLDEENEQSVYRALFELSRQTTTILITHDMSVIDQNDNIVYIDQGHVIESGTHEKLLNTNGRYAHYYRLAMLKEINTDKGVNSYAV